VTQRVAPEQADGTWFSETQRFDQPFIKLVVYPIAIVIWVYFIVQVLADVPVGDDPAPDAFVVVFWLLFGIGLPGLFHGIRMETRVGPAGVHLRHFPFHRQFLRWPFEEIRSAQARTYRPLVEYGGWGIRIGPAGWAYNVKGNRGVQLEIDPGRRVLIGSQDPESLAAAIAKGRTR
jgi:hypothetical protein